MFIRDISMILGNLVTKYKTNKNAIIKVVVETKLNCYKGTLELGDYLIDNNFEFLKLDECSCSALGNLKVDKTIILVSDIISFTYSDLTFPTKG